MTQAIQTDDEALRHFSVRLPESLARVIDGLTKTEVRSANYIVNELLTEALAARDRKQGKKVSTAA